MRAMLIPNLLQVIQRNQNFGVDSASVFEIGKVYARVAGGAPSERLSVAGAMAGRLWKSAWSLPAEALEADFFLCKGAVESLLSALNIRNAEFEQTAHPLLHPTRGAKLVIDGIDTGILGEVSPAARQSLGLRGRPCVFELDFGALMESAPDVVGYAPLPRYPALYRHMAVVVSDDVEYKRLVDTVADSGRGIVEDVDLLDVYKGEQIGADQRSLTLSIVFRSREKTLTDDEVNSVLAAIKEALSQNAAASFR